jgi:hypothetical protein
LHYQFCCYSRCVLYRKSKIINSPAAAVYNYVNDYRNWEDFGTWSGQDDEMNLVIRKYKEKDILGKEEMVPAV